MYRQKVRRRIYGPDVISYLLKDEQFPRAIAFSLRDIGASLAVLPRNAGPHKQLGDLRRMLAVLEVARLDVARLHQWIDDAQLALGELHGLIHHTWFEPSANAVGHAPVPVAAQNQTQQAALKG
jgi:uncharacterized alpha-E superfamily protein